VIDLDFDLDELLDQAVAEGELEAGVDPALVAWRSPGVQVRDGIAAREAGNQGWTADEERFLAQCVGRFSEAEIAAVLGRSVSAVKIRRSRHLGLPGASRRPELITGHQMGAALGIDGHAVVALVDRGIIPAWRYSELEMRLTRRVTFLRWAVNPLHWVYFLRSVREPERFGDGHLRRLVERQKTRWGDEWWTSGEVAAWYGVHHTDVNRYVHAGKLTGTQYGNWYFRRSEALKPGLVFYKGMGAALGDVWNEEADLFLLIGVALGVQQAEIARRMGWPLKRLVYRWQLLRRGGLIDPLIDKYGLVVTHHPQTQRVRARWEDYGYMFKDRSKQ